MIKFSPALSRLPLLAGVASIALGLAACAVSSPSASSAGTAVLPPAQAAQVQQMCAATAPALAAATSSASPSEVSAVAVYPAAYCSQLASTGVMPSTTTSGTPAWLTTTITAVGVAAQLAGYVLPLLGAL